MNFDYPYGATPLDPNEIHGLIPLHISTQSELNEWEQVNILETEKWLSKHAPNREKVLEIDFIKDLHYQMFNKTWTWAGKLRRSNKNIGIDWPLINIEAKNLIDDIIYQIENKSYGIDEIATRFHHRFVAIHLFPNGNGRHARLLTDLLLIAEKQPRFSWGKNTINALPRTRKQYIDALRAADQRDYTLLLDFVRM